MQKLADDPPYLTVGTEVSAKYKGAFCEAKIRKVVRVVKCKVTFKAGNGGALLTDDQIKGALRIGAVVEGKHPDKNQYLEATINKIQDCSQYTVVFDDGDITTLRRSALCLKSGRHFNESETLDQLPLTHPEHFSNPVVGGRRGVRRRVADKDESSEEEDDEVPAKSREAKKKYEKELDMGKIVCVESTDKKKAKDTWFPALVVSPAAQETVKIRIKDEYLVRSFRDGRYYTVPKKEITEFTKDSMGKYEPNSNVLRTAVEKALMFLEKNELPPHWDREVLFANARHSESGEGEEQLSESEASEDDPRNEEKDRFIAQLYKFMDDRSTPLNKVPQVCSKDLDLHKLFKIVTAKGGYTKVTNQSQWKSVTMKLGYGNMPSTSTVNLVRQAYKKFLVNFEEFYRKLGCTWTPRSANTTTKPRSSRSIFRERGTPTSSRESVRESKKGGDEDEAPPPPQPTTPKKDKEKESKEKVAPPAEEKEKAPAPSPDETASPPRIEAESESPEVKPKVIIAEEKPAEEPRKSARGRQPKKDRDAEDSASPSASSRKRRQTASSTSKDRDKRESSVASSTKDEGGGSAPPTPSSSNTPTSAAKKPGSGRGKYKRNSIKSSEPEEKEPAPVKEEEKPPEPIIIAPPKTTLEIRLGDKLEVYYPKSEGKTYEAKVIDINEKTEKFLVHYTGWNNRYDEWIDRARVSENITLKMEQSDEVDAKELARPSSSAGNAPSSKGPGTKQRKGRNSSSATSNTSGSSNTTSSTTSGAGTRSGSSKAAAAAAAAASGITPAGSKRRRSTSSEIVPAVPAPKRRRTRQKSGQDTSAASTAASDSEPETSDSDGKSIKSEKAPSGRDTDSKILSIKEKEPPATALPLPVVGESKVSDKKFEDKDKKSSVGQVGLAGKAEKAKKPDLDDVDDEISSGSAASTKSTKSKERDKDVSKVVHVEDTKDSSSSSGSSGQVIDLDQIRSEMKGLDKIVKPGGSTVQATVIHSSSPVSSPAPPTLSAAVGSSPQPEPSKVDIYEFQDDVTEEAASSITTTAPKLKMFSPVSRAAAAAPASNITEKGHVVVSSSPAELVTKLKSQQNQDQDKSPVPIVTIENVEKSLGTTSSTSSTGKILASDGSSELTATKPTFSQVAPPPSPPPSIVKDAPKIISHPPPPVQSGAPAVIPAKPVTPSTTPTAPAPVLTPPPNTIVSLSLLTTPPLPVLTSPAAPPSLITTPSPSSYINTAAAPPVLASTPVIIATNSAVKGKSFVGGPSPIRGPSISPLPALTTTPVRTALSPGPSPSIPAPTPSASVAHPPPPILIPSSLLATPQQASVVVSTPGPLVTSQPTPSFPSTMVSTPLVSSFTANPPSQGQRQLISATGVPRPVITISSPIATPTTSTPGRPLLTPIVAATVSTGGIKIDPKGTITSAGALTMRKPDSIFPHLIQHSPADPAAIATIPTISIVSAKPPLEAEIQGPQTLSQQPPPPPVIQQQPPRVAATIPPPPPPVVMKVAKPSVFGPAPIVGTGTDPPKPKKKKPKVSLTTTHPVKTLAPLPTSGAPPPPPVVVSTSSSTSITGTPTPGRKTPVKKRIPPPMDSPGKPMKVVGPPITLPSKPGKMNPEAMNAAIASVGAAAPPAIAVPTTVITPTPSLFQTHHTPTSVLFASSVAPSQPPPAPVTLTKTNVPVTIKSSAESIAASIAAVASMGSSMSTKSSPPTTTMSGKSGVPMKRFMKDSPSDKVVLGKEKGIFSVAGGPPSLSIQQQGPPLPTIMIGKSLPEQPPSQQPPPPPITIQAKFQPVAAHTMAGTPGIHTGPAVTFVKTTVAGPGAPSGQPHHIMDHHHQVHQQSNLPKHPVIIIPSAPVVIKPAPYQHPSQPQHHTTIQPVIVSKPVHHLEGQSQPLPHPVHQQQQQSVLVSTTIAGSSSSGMVKSAMLPISVTPSVQVTSVPGMQSSSSLLATVPAPAPPPIELKPVTVGDLHPHPPTITVTKATTVMKSISPDIVAVSSYSHSMSSSSRGSTIIAPSVIKHDERISINKEPEIVVKPAPASAQIVFHSTASQESRRAEAAQALLLPAITITPKPDPKEPEENSLLCEEIIPGSPTAGEDAEDKGDDEVRVEKEPDATKKPAEEAPKAEPALSLDFSTNIPLPSPPLGGGNKPVIVLGPKYGEDLVEDEGFIFEERKYPRFGDDDDDDDGNKLEEGSVDSPMGPPSEGREADLPFRDSFSEGGDHSPPSSPSTTSTISTDDSSRRHDTSRMSPTPGGSSKSKDSDDDDVDSDVGSKSTHLDDVDSKHGSTRGSTRIRNQTSRLGRSPSPPMSKRRRIMRRNKSPEEVSQFIPRTVRTSSGRKITPVGRDIESIREREKEVKQTPPAPPVNLAKPPKTGRFNFIPNLDGVHDPDQRISMISQAINDLKEQYQKTKTEAASFDRRVKRWKRRVREKERLARQEATRSTS